MRLSPRKRPRAACLARFAALCLVSSSACAQPPVQVTDDAGLAVTLSAPARRIVSLAPHLTEILFAAGAGGRVAAVSDYSDFPPAARALPRVGSALQIDLERLLQLDPDLVAVWGSGTPPSAVERLRGFGVSVFVSEPRRLEDIATNLARLGALAGVPDAAADAADAFRAGLTSLRQRYAGRRPVSVFFEIEHRPLMTLGPAHVFSELLATCGGRNVFADLDALAPAVSREAVLARNPEVVLVSGSLAGLDGVLAWWRGTPGLAAARNGGIHAVPADLVVRPGPRLLEGAGVVCEVLEEARRED